MLIGGQNGIDVNDSYLVIANNTIINATLRGIIIYAGINNIIKNNNLRYLKSVEAWGISTISSGSHSDIYGNIIDNYRDGIYSTDNNITIRDNIVTNSLLWSICLLIYFRRYNCCMLIL